MTHAYISETGSATEETEPLQAALENPEAAQAVTLFRITRGAARSAFGVKHGFDSISSVGNYRSLVPVSGFHSHRSMISLQRATGAEILTMDDVIAFVPAAASGPRRQDCLVTVQDMFSRQHLMSEAVETLIRQGCRNVLDLSVLTASEYTVCISGICPTVTGFQWLAAVEDEETRAYLFCLVAASLRDVDGLIAGNVVALEHLSGVLDRHGEAIVSDLAARTVGVHRRVDPTIARRIRELIDPSEDLLDALQVRLNEGHPLAVSDLLPDVAAVGIDASTTDCIGANQELGPDVRLIDLGCSLPEGLLSFAHGQGEGAVPSLLDVFFEFAGDENDTLLGLHEIAQGVDYTVHITTASGLYRCRLALKARVAGWQGQCPRLKFMRTEADAGVTRSAVHAGMALSAVQETLEKMGAPRPFVRLSKRADSGFRLTLSRCTVEALGSEAVRLAVEERLCETSLRYARLRELGRIGPVDVLASPAVRPAVQQGATGAGVSAA